MARRYSTQPTKGEAMTQTKFTAESGHWYDRNGKPAYTVIGKNGQERNTTLRDARKLDLVPSVTTVMKVAAAPGLERWKQEQVLLAALTLPRSESESEADWLARVIEDSRETGRKAADAGTAIHASIQAYFEDGIPDPDHDRHVRGFMTTLREHFGERSWISEMSFCHIMGYGGKVDLYSPKADDDWGIVVDIKTKEFGPDDKVSGFDEHLMQLAAYRAGLGMAKARCANVFVSRSHPGLVSVVEWTAEELDKGWALFTRLLDFWQIKNDHK
jgi:hypothetical protein